MNSKQFTFRRYKKEDADILYTQYENYIWSNIQPYFSAGIGMSKTEFLGSFQKYNNRVYRPPIIASGKDDVPFGIVNVSYKHANHYYEISLHIWDHLQLIKDVLQQILDQVLHAERSDHLLIEIPEYETELKNAAVVLGLHHVGTIPDYLSHDNKLYDKHFYVITSEKWHSLKESD